MGVIARCLFCAVSIVGAALAADPVGIRTIDFKNFVYPWNHDICCSPATWSWMGPADSTVQLTNGHHSFADPEDPPPDGGPYVMFRSVTYGDLDGDQVEEAAVDLIYGTGGTGNWHYLYVYSMKNGRPTLLGRLESSERGGGGLVRIAILRKRLVLDFQDSDRQTSACCSEGYIRVTYRWNAGGFVEAAPRQKGSLK